MKKGGGSEFTIIIGPSKSVLVYALHSLEYVLGLARFRVFVPNIYIYRLLESWPKTQFFNEKLCSAMKLIWGSMGTLKSRIVDFGMKISQKNCKSYQCIQKKSQFVAVYGLVASLDRTSSKLL